MSNTEAWKMTSRLFASGDRKIEMIHVSEDLPDPNQIAAVYTKMALIFGEAKATEDNADAQVHRIEFVIAPEIVPTSEGRGEEK